MVQLIFESHTGERNRVSAAAGVSLMQAALGSGVGGILGDCGGALACATCHVRIAPEWMEEVGSPSEQEAAMLEMAIDPDETSRLSCQIALTDELDGLRIILPASQL